MAVVVSEFTSFVSTNNASAYTCMANVTPPTNQLILLWHTHKAASNLTLNAVTGCGLTWNSVASIKWNVSGFAQMSLWTARGTPSTGTIHLAFSGSVQNCFVTIDQCTGESGTLVQSATTSGAAVSTLTAILSAFSGSGNGMAVAWSKASDNDAINPRDSGNANFTPKLGQVVGTGAAGDAGTLASAWSNAAITNSGATWASARSGAGIACEINVAAAGGALDSPYYSAYYSHVVTGVA